MKKLIVIALALATVGFMTVTDVQAQEGDLEISGHVDTVVGWQRTHGNAGCAGLGCPTASSGILSDGLLVPGGPSTDQFGFFLDEVEIDLAKQFGENIRLRADIDFRPGGNITESTTGGIVGLEQGYVTINVPIGNGWEWLFGRFNSGVGLDPMDRNELSTVSFSTLHRSMLPHNLTGMDWYYAFDENWSMDILVVNNLTDNFPGVTAPNGVLPTDVPSFGFTIEYASGEVGEGSWVKLSGLAGPQRGTKKGWSFLGDLAASVNVTEGFYIDIEGLYRQDDSASGVGSENFQYLGGTAQLRYAFSDIWDGTLRFGYLWDLDNGQASGVSIVSANVQEEIVGQPVGIGVAGQQYDITLATGYEITDGARFVLEGRYDLQKASAGGKTSVYGAAAGFYYDF